MGTPFKMGRPADDNLPEVVQVPHPPVANANNFPEVVPDSSPEYAQQRYYIETDKYPAYYDTAPKLPYEQPFPGMPSPEQHYQQPWTGGDHPGSAMISPNSSLPWQSFGPGADDQQTFVGSEAPPDKRICGVRKRLFIIIAVIVGLVIVGAAVGGGVGGSMAASQGSDEAATAETETNSENTTPTTTTATRSSTTSTASEPSITFLNNQTDPEEFYQFEFQAFEKNNYLGRATDRLVEEGFHDLGFNATSYVWRPTYSNCCITFCASETEPTGGYRCDPWKRNATENPDGFPRVHLWCGGRNDEEKREKMIKTCS